MSSIRYKLKRWIALGVCTCYIISLFPEAFAAIPAIEFAAKSEIPRFFNIDIPTELASVDEWYEAPPKSNPKLIVHIQDAHSNYEAQTHIRDVIRYLNKNYGFQIILVEGAAEELDPKHLKLFPDKETNLKLMDELAKIGEVTGTEMLLMEDEKSFKTEGIEKPELYRKNLEALQSVYQEEGLTTGYLETAEKKMGQVASRTFSPHMIQALAEWRKFELGHREFMPFVANLARISKETLNLDLDVLYSQIEWPQLTRLLVLQRVEKELGAGAPGRTLRDQALMEKEVMIEFFKDKKASPGLIAGLKKFDEKSANLNRLGVSESKMASAPRALIEMLVEEGNRIDFKIAEYPAFAKYAGFLIIRSEIVPGILFVEIKKLFDRILDALVKEPSSSAQASGKSSSLASTNEPTSKVSEDQVIRQRLLLIYRDEVLVKKLLRLELNRAEWLQITARRNRFDLRDFNRRLGEALAQTTSFELNKMSKSEPVARLELAFENAFKFYEAATNREDYFFQKMQSVFEKTDKAILVSGGFHTEGMKSLMREHDISYGTLTPRITKEFSNETYKTVMMTGVADAQKQSQMVAQANSRLANLSENSKVSPVPLLAGELKARGQLEGLRRSELRDEIVKKIAKTLAAPSPATVSVVSPYVSKSPRPEEVVEAQKSSRGLNSKGVVSSFNFRSFLIDLILSGLNRLPSLIRSPTGAETVVKVRAIKKKSDLGRDLGLRSLRKNPEVVAELMRAWFENWNKTEAQVEPLPSRNMSFNWPKNSDDLLQSLSILPKKEGFSLYVGSSGPLDYSVIGVRESPVAILMGNRPFHEAVAKAMKQMPEDTSGMEISEIATMFMGKLGEQGISFRADQTASFPWIINRTQFKHIQEMFRKGRVFITSTDLTDSRFVEQLARQAWFQAVHVDIVSIGNPRDHTPNNQWSDALYNLKASLKKLAPFRIIQDVWVEGANRKKPTEEALYATAIVGNGDLQPDQMTLEQWWKRSHSTSRSEAIGVERRGFDDFFVNAQNISSVLSSSYSIRVVSGVGGIFSSVVLGFLAIHAAIPAGMILSVVLIGLSEPYAIFYSLRALNRWFNGSRAGSGSSAIVDTTSTPGTQYTTSLPSAGISKVLIPKPLDPPAPVISQVKKIQKIISNVPGAVKKAVLEPSSLLARRLGNETVQILKKLKLSDIGASLIKGPMRPSFAVIMLTFGLWASNASAEEINNFSRTPGLREVAQRSEISANVPGIISNQPLHLVQILTAEQLLNMRDTVQNLILWNSRAKVEFIIVGSETSKLSDLISSWKTLGIDQRVQIYFALNEFQASKAAVALDRDSKVPALFIVPDLFSIGVLSSKPIVRSEIRLDLMPTAFIVGLNQAREFPGKTLAQMALRLFERVKGIIERSGNVWAMTNASISGVEAEISQMYMAAAQMMKSA